MDIAASEVWGDGFTHFLKSPSKNNMFGVLAGLWLLLQFGKLKICASDSAKSRGFSSATLAFV